MRSELLLFHEGPSRIVISTADAGAVQAIAAKHNVEAPVIGTTAVRVLKIDNRKVRLVEQDTDELRSKWERALPAALGSKGGA